MRRPNVLLIWTDQQRWDTIRAGGNPLMHTSNLDRLAAAGTLFPHAYVNCPVCMPSRQSVLSGRYPGTLGVRTNGVEMSESVECIQHVLRPHGYHTAQLGKLHFRNHASPFRDHREPHPRYGFDVCTVSDEPGCYDDPYIAWVAAHDPAAVPLCRVDTPPAWTGEPVRVHPRNVHQPYVFQGPEELTHSAFVADTTCDYLRSRAARAHEGEPFFAVAGFYAPHAPLNPPARELDRYNPNDMPLPHRAPGENFHDPQSGAPVTDAQWRIIRQHYAALVSHVDRCIGTILRTLDELGLTDETLVIFTSDHGENLGDHGLIQKGYWFDSSTRVPLIVKPPVFATTSFSPGRVAGAAAGAVAGAAAAPARGAAERQPDSLDAMVELVDLAPTIVDYCGLPVPPFFQGRSLRPLLDEVPAGASVERASGVDDPRSVGTQRGSVLFEHGAPEDPRSWKGVRTRDYLYARHRDGREHLYDLAADPHQTHDLLATGSAAEPDATASTGGRPAGTATNSLLHEARYELLQRLIDSDPHYPRRTAHY